MLYGLADDLTAFTPAVFKVPLIGPSSSVDVTAPMPVTGCPLNADAWQSSQNGYCADEYGWPLRPDGSVMTRQDIEANARNAALKKYWPVAAGAALLLLFLGTGGRR